MIGGSPRLALPGQPLPSDLSSWQAERVTEPFVPFASQGEAVGPDLAYNSGGKDRTISLAEIMALLTAGHLEASELYDPKESQNADLFECPSDLATWLLSRRILPPGKYTYVLDWQTSAAVIVGGRYDNSLTPFAAGNVGKGPFAGGRVSVRSLTSVVFHFVNTTDQAATYQIYGSPTPGGPFGPIPGLGTGSVPVGNVTPQDLPIGLNLSTMIPYVYATLTFSSAPQTGFVQIIPIARKVA